MKKYNRNTTFFEYYFTNNIKKKSIYNDTCVNINTVRNVHEKCNKLFDNSWIIKEYSLYRHKNKELYVYPEGSSYCYEYASEIVTRDDYPNNIFVIKNNKIKLRNDFFESEYMYDSNLDIIEIQYIFTKNITIILRTNYENTFSNDKIESVAKISNLTNISKSNKFWSDVLLKVHNNTDEKDIKKCIDIINESF